MLLILHIQRVVLATEKTTVTQQVSHIPIKCQSRSWSQIRSKVNGSYHGDSPLLKPTGIQVETKLLPGLTNRKHRKLIGVKTMSVFGYELHFLLSGCNPPIATRTFGVTFDDFGPWAAHQTAFSAACNSDSEILAAHSRQ